MHVYVESLQQKKDLMHDFSRFQFILEPEMLPI